MTVVVSDVVDECTHFFGGTCTVVFLYLLVSKITNLILITFSLS